jgi:hypothetical protein
MRCLTLQDISKIHKGIRFSVNEGVELVSTVMLLSTQYYARYPYLKTEFPFQYVKDLLTEFGDYKNHDSIQLFDEMASNGFAFDKPFRSILSSVNHTSFYDTIHEFSAEIGFSQFFASENSYFSNVLERNIERLGDVDYENILVSYLGHLPKPMHVILAQSIGSCGFQLSTSDEEICILGCLKQKGSLPIFVDELYFPKLIIHEFAHSFVNPLVDHAIIRQSVIDTAYQRLPDGYQEQYGNGKGMISEQIVRSITARILSLFIDKEQGESQLAFDNSQGFVLVNEIYDLLKEDYELKRDIFPSFGQFCSALINRINNADVLTL